VVKRDVIRLFFAETVEKTPAQCEYSLQLTTAKEPTYFCFRGGQTKPGRCQ
jgi:hypothetical protein